MAYTNITFITKNILQPMAIRSCMLDISLLNSNSRGNGWNKFCLKMLLYDSLDWNLRNIFKKDRFIISQLKKRSWACEACPRECVCETNTHDGGEEGAQNECIEPPEFTPPPSPLSLSFSLSCRNLCKMVSYLVCSNSSFG